MILNFVYFKGQKKTESDEKRVSHDRNDESPEAKALWFQSLTLEERVDLLCEFTNLILSLYPKIAESKDVTSTSGRVCILSKNST